jgi:hypothetical protein
MKRQNIIVKIKNNNYFVMCAVFAVENAAESDGNNLHTLQNKQTNKLKNKQTNKLKRARQFTQ